MKTFKALSIFMLIFILLVRLDGILAYLSEEERLSQFFRLKGFLKCPLTLNRGPQKADPMPVWVGGLGGWWTSQRAVRADFLWGRVGALSAGSQPSGSSQNTGLEALLHRTRSSVWYLRTRAHLCWCCPGQGLPCGFWGR